MSAVPGRANLERTGVWHHVQEEHPAKNTAPGIRGAERKMQHKNHAANYALQQGEGVCSGRLRLRVIHDEALDPATDASFW